MDHDPLSNTHRPEVVDGLAGSHKSESPGGRCNQGLSAGVSDSKHLVDPAIQTTSSTGVPRSDDSVSETPIHADPFGLDVSDGAAFGKQTNADFFGLKCGVLVRNSRSVLFITFVVIAIINGIFWPFRLTQAAWIDCNKASTSVDRSICTNQTLFKLDQELDDLYYYRINRESASEIEKKQLERSRGNG